jgi:predicted ArsR family transcriptional regulator
MAMAGLAYKEIAQRLQVSTGTVRKHFARLCEKYGAANRCQLAHVATREGVVGGGGDGRLGRLRAQAEPLDLLRSHT